MSCWKYPEKHPPVHRLHVGSHALNLSGSFSYRVVNVLEHIPRCILRPSVQSLLSEGDAQETTYVTVVIAEGVEIHLDAVVRHSFHALSALFVFVHVHRDFVTKVLPPNKPQNSNVFPGA